MNLDHLRQNPFFLNDEQIKWVEDTLNGLSLEEKVGQLFCIIPDAADEGMEHQMT